MNHPTPKPALLSCTRGLPGFTLVEVLTVITIIAILMAAGAIGIGNLNTGKGVTSAVATCESLFEEARTIAVSKRCRSRVMVDVDDATSDNYLRRVVIVRGEEVVDVDGNPVIGVDGEPEISWILLNRGYEMPKGTFYSKIYSKKSEGTADIDVETMTMTNESGTPVADYDGDYAIYEFNGEGIFEDAGASFVVGAGIRPKNQEPKTTKGGSRDFAGFVVWRNGRTSTFRSPEQISGEIKNLDDSGENF